MPESVDASDQMIDNWNKQVQESAAKYQAMAGLVESQTITERSKDSSVEVTISSRGLLTGLVIAEGAGGKRMSEVSAQVMLLVQRAQSKIPELLQQAMAQTIGTQDVTANRMFDDAKSQFPPAPPEEPPTLPDPPRQHRFGPENDDAPPPPPQQPKPPVAPPPPPPPPRRRPAGDQDDEDFGGPILS
ncbi:YbaB/EbfC family nucleoid-associated protein [Amycolatopsis sp. H20-H5]|uniref:YbaB/EbfC family nucleoid-associated protein n=1 Tax=Amycolatopsis sp. H20-H5 TaxID=3046309 RepID=UPI002DBA017E|nr:YbaB/EbfC family nucleoid-associated protein [Amycolatopsis sp. H20-H5]MEC3979852.1 YbaB/EbfC family nucleoid-associated protein [Amycolatopsis sp. H20-H5]